MSSISDRWEGSWYSKCGRRCGEAGTHVKINLPVFKDEDAKEALTYQSWRWDLTVYWHAGCRDCTLLPYTIWSLQGYPSELVWSCSMDITLDNVLTILDEHYIITWKHWMHWIRSYSNYGWQTKRLYQTGVSTSQDISKSYLFPSQIASPLSE